MYLFAGGKDENISIVTFLPAWWGVDEPEQSQEALEAKAARIFGSMFGGAPSGS